MRRVILIDVNNNVSVESYDSILSVENYVSPHWGLTYEIPIKNIPATDGVFYLMTDDALGACETDEEVFALHNDVASKLMCKDVYGNCAVVKMTAYDPDTYVDDALSHGEDTDWVDIKDDDIKYILRMAGKSEI